MESRLASLLLFVFFNCNEEIIAYNIINPFFYSDDLSENELTQPPSHLVSIHKPGPNQILSYKLQKLSWRVIIIVIQKLRVIDNGDWRMVIGDDEL